MAFLDPKLELLLEQEPAQRLVQAMLDWTGTETELAKLGVKVLSLEDNVAFVEFPLSAAERLRLDNRIDQVTVSEPSRPELDVSRVIAAVPNEVILDSAGKQVFTGPTGRGVTIAIIDTGFDVFHRSLRDLDGKTRFLCVWDISGKPSRIDGLVAPAGFGRGVEYTRADIDLALGTPARNETEEARKRRRKLKGNLEMLRGAHGTLVAAIAAGNGGQGQPVVYGPFLGIAPEADIVGIVARKPQDWMVAFRYAKSVIGTKPGVINFSRGEHYGPHLPFGGVERWVENFIQNKGIAVIKSAGNQGKGSGHAQGTLSRSTSVNLEVAMTSRALGTFPLKRRIRLELWYGYGSRDDARLSVAITPPGGSNAYDIPRSRKCTAPREQLRAIHGKHAKYVGLSAVMLELTPIVGTWMIRMTAPAAGPPVRWHAWLEWDASRHGLVKLGPASVLSSSTTMTIPSAATGIISVGSFQTKHRTGRPGRRNGPISATSARGPTPDNTPLSPTVTMPTLTAPGEYISSALPRGDPGCASLAAGNNDCYGLAAGTSLAAPHVAGAVALMLQEVPSLTPAQIAKALRDSATAGTSTDENVWGAGRLDIRGAIDAAGP